MVRASFGMPFFVVRSPGKIGLEAHDERKEAAEIIEGLREQVAWMRELLENMPPTLAQALDLHAKWRQQQDGGVRLDLSNIDLSGVNMRGAILIDADLQDIMISEEAAHRIWTFKQKESRIGQTVEGSSGIVQSKGDQAIL